jgi:hypothetical protein
MKNVRSEMHKRKSINKARRIDFVREARAGLIPASDDIADERRLRTNQTARIIRIVKTHSGSVARVSDDLAITNILSDLRHYCDCRGLGFKKLDKAACALYLEEKAEEAALPMPTRH